MAKFKGFFGILLAYVIMSVFTGCNPDEDSLSEGSGWTQGALRLSEGESIKDYVLQDDSIAVRVYTRGGELVSTGANEHPKLAAGNAYITHAESGLSFEGNEKISLEELTGSIDQKFNYFVDPVSYDLIIHMLVWMEGRRSTLDIEPGEPLYLTTEVHAQTDPAATGFFERATIVYKIVNDRNMVGAMALSKSVVYSNPADTVLIHTTDTVTVTIMDTVTIHDTTNTTIHDTVIKDDTKDILKLNVSGHHNNWLNASLSGNHIYLQCNNTAEYWFDYTDGSHSQHGSLPYSVYMDWLINGNLVFDHAVDGTYTFNGANVNVGGNNITLSLQSHTIDPIMIYGMNCSASVVKCYMEPKTMAITGTTAVITFRDADGDSRTVNVPITINTVNPPTPTTIDVTGTVLRVYVTDSYKDEYNAPRETFAHILVDEGGTKKVLTAPWSSSLTAASFTMVKTLTTAEYNYIVNNSSNSKGVAIVYNHANYGQYVWGMCQYSSSTNKITYWTLSGQVANYHGVIGGAIGGSNSSECVHGYKVAGNDGIATITYDGVTYSFE
ncbi:MAG: hypothetical protein IJ529_00535 [Alphaproteobacteria bacterium]|nr:hypothetical protein [Alphaproteobacteria bacterium]